MDTVVDLLIERAETRALVLRHLNKYGLANTSGAKHEERRVAVESLRWALRREET